MKRKKLKMLQSCKNCHSQFDNLKERSDCPHLEFPKVCKRHNRFNCDNLECKRGDILNFSKEKEEVA